MSRGTNPTKLFVRNCQLMDLRASVRWMDLTSIAASGTLRRGRQVLRTLIFPTNGHPLEVYSEGLRLVHLTRSLLRCCYNRNNGTVTSPWIDFVVNVSTGAGDAAVESRSSDDVGRPGPAECQPAA